VGAYHNAIQSARTTANKDADLNALVSQSELLLPQDRSSGVHTATASLLAATPSADSASGHLDPLGSLPPYSQLSVTWLMAQGRPMSLARASPLQWEVRQHSSGEPCLRVMALFRAPQYLTCYHTLCLPAHLYNLLLTAINICYRNLCGCLAMLLESTSHKVMK
jgi:hypothetical protein